MKTKMEERGKVALSCNWNTLGDVDLKSVLVENSINSLGIEIGDLKADNCVCLIQNKSPDKSKAELEIKANGYMTNIDLLSEAQVTEVFGVNDEYLLTNVGEFFDDWEEMAVYYTKISLPNIPLCKLKFTRSKFENRLWIYGMRVIVQNTSEEPKSPVEFNLEQIKRLLGNHNIGNRNNFKNILQLFLENVQSNNSTGTLRKKLGNNDLNSHITDIVCHENDKGNCVEEILSRLNLNTSESSESKESNVKEGRGGTSGNLILAYIDKKCHEIKNDILHEVDLKLNILREETNYKLDKIISLLENERIKIKS